MKEWQKVRRMTPRQKGEILERLGDGYRLAKHHEYMVLQCGKLSDYVLRRCPHCGQIHIWTIDSWYPGLNLIVCSACGKQSKYLKRREDDNIANG